MYYYVSSVVPVKDEAFLVSPNEPARIVPSETANQFVAVVNGYVVANHSEEYGVEYPVFPRFMAASVYAMCVAAAVEGQPRPTVEVLGISFGD